MLPSHDEGLVQLCEGLLGEEHLTAHLQHGRHVRSPQPVWDAVDGGDIARHILTDPAVTARCRHREPAVQIGKVHRQPVDLQLAQIAFGGYPGQPFVQFLLVEDVVEAQHPLPVGNGGELGDPRIGDPRGGGSKEPQLRVTIFQLSELSQPLVVFGVGNDGLGSPVVGVAGGQEKLVEFLPAGFGIGRNRHKPNAVIPLPLRIMR